MFNGNFVALSGLTGQKLSLEDLTAEKFEVARSGVFSIDLGKYSQGIYYLRMNGKTSKVIKL